MFVTVRFRQAFKKGGGVDRRATYWGAEALKLTNGWNCVKVQSRPLVILHCEHAPSWHVSHEGPTGCDDTAVMTPMGVVRPLSEKTRCGRSRVANSLILPSVNTTVQLKGCTSE